MKRVQILGLPADTVTYDETVALVAEHIESRKPFWILAINPEKIMKARSQKELASLLLQADLFIPDGIGVLLAGKIKGEYFPQRVTGADLFDRLMLEASSKCWKVFLLGAAPGIAAKVAEKYRRSYPALQIVGIQDGYFSGEETELCEIIKRARPELLFVAMGSPRQEQFIHNHIEELGVPVCMGVGGTFNVAAGVVKRAPDWMQKLGLEWCYRLLKEPHRIIRMVVLPKFLLHVLTERDS